MVTSHSTIHFLWQIVGMIDEIFWGVVL